MREQHSPALTAMQRYEFDLNVHFSPEGSSETGLHCIGSMKQALSASIVWSFVVSASACSIRQAELKDQIDPRIWILQPPSLRRPCLTSGPTLVTLRSWKRTLSAQTPAKAPEEPKRFPISSVGEKPWPAGSKANAS